MSINKLFDDFKTEQAFMAMLSKSIKNRIKNPLQKIMKINSNLSESKFGLHYLLIYLKKAVGSDQSDSNIDAYDVLQTCYKIIQKNILDSID